MDFIVDHDYHIHSQLSLCSGDPEETPARILAYAEANDYRAICLTDHFWDETVPGASEWYQIQNYEHICQSLPLPQGKKTRFMFGCECEMDKYQTVGLSRDHFDRFDFVIVPINHLHMTGLTIDEEDAPSWERRAILWVERFHALLDKDLPFEKMGVAHLTDGLTAEKGQHVQIFNTIPQGTLDRLFTKAASRGIGIELNFRMDRLTKEELAATRRVMLTAKAMGCRFYMGSDAHEPGELDIAADNFRKIAAWLELKESDKFVPLTR